MHAIKLMLILKISKKLNQIIHIGDGLDDKYESDFSE